VEPPARDPTPAAESPPRDASRDEGRRGSYRWVDADPCVRHACSGRGHRGGSKVGQNGAPAKAVVELIERARPAHAPRSD
jgi:hypothetical protein